MDPEVRLLAERAGIRRMALEGLLDVIPEDLWGRRETGQEWTARNHLEHLATADILMRETVVSVTSGERVARTYVERRAELIAEVAGKSMRDLREQMAAERRRSLALLARTEARWFDVGVMIPGAIDSLGRLVELSLRTIVTAWAEHDTGHEMAIRRAITTPPDAASVAATARFRR